MSAGALAGLTVMVTGGSGGLGKACARALVAVGACVVGVGKRL